MRPSAVPGAAARQIPLSQESRPLRRAATRGSPPLCNSAFDHRQSRSLVLGEDCIDDLVERFPAHYLVDLVEGEVDAVVVDPALREIVGADAFRPVAAAHLALALGGPRAVTRLPFHFVEPRTQHLEGSRLVLV